jgi:hypothetical protein
VEALPSFLFGGKRLTLLALHCFINNFTKNSAAGFPLSLLGLKPQISFFVDIDYNSGHGAKEKAVTP